MSLHNISWGTVLIGLLVVVGLPLGGHWYRRSAEPRCALDGTRIEPIYKVEITDSQGCHHVFCCPRCGQRWLEHQPTPPQAITVVDEMSGNEVAASKAYYVRSVVVTIPSTGNRIHAFRSQAAAEDHALTHEGIVLSASENPFRP
jgi:hypothetical protein